jgi:hypothetical protein
VVAYITVLTFPEDLTQQATRIMQDLAGALQFPRVEQLKMILALVLNIAVYKQFTMPI